MFRSTVRIQQIFLAAVMALGGAAYAAEAGHIVFTAGDATVSGKGVMNGQAVQEGDEVATGGGGYVYVKTVDNGFLILRPNSRARIVSYHIDAARPADTRIKLELVSGVARHISGDAVKQSKQNFRFNTPVAAIGVRGTDFTVFTDQNTSRVAVIAGGVVVSGFAGSCGPEGSGPCEGIASRELFAAQTGQILQVRKGQNAPQILPINGLSPDLIAPPRNDEPAAKATTGSTGTAGTSTTAANGVSLDARKGANLQLATNPAPTPITTPIVMVTPPVGVPVVPVSPPVPLAQIQWGRWQAVLDKPASIDLVQATDAKGRIIAINSNFALLKTAGREWEVPTTGSIGFALKQSEAYVLDESSRLTTPAQLANGKLQVDFAKASFSTSFDLLSGSEKFPFQSQGTLARDGQLDGNGQHDAPTNMSVTGLVNPQARTAAYIFQGRIDSSRLASGATAWAK